MLKQERSYYKVQYSCQGVTHEVYVSRVAQSNMWGFVEISGFVFGSNQSQVVVDPSQEKLKAEFEHVTCCYIPLHHIIRIDRISQPGVAKLSSSGASKHGQVAPLVSLYHPKHPPGER